MSKNKRIGKIGENIAKEYFLQKGHTILEQNYFTPLGEIDLISKKGEMLFFIEVKTRTSLLFGDGIEAIDRRKVQKIQKAAENYITDNRCLETIQLLLVSIMYRSRSHFEIEVVEAFN